jgi:hypothetical protein
MMSERLEPNMARWLRHLAAGSAFMLLPLVGCGGAQLTAGVVFDYPVYYVDGPPPRIYDHPSVYYRGRPAYLVNDRWYYRTQRGWVYFREEPRELRAYRDRRHVVPAERRSDRFRGKPPRAEPSERRRYHAHDEPTQRRYRADDD